MRNVVLPIVVVLGLVGCSNQFSSESYGEGMPARFSLAAAAPAELRLLTYNVFLRPAPISFGDLASCRAVRIGRWLGRGDADIVALTETFHAGDAASLTRAASQRLPHQIVSEPAGSGILGVSGGVSILSRWPIESSRSITYDTCSGLFSDCLAAKGAVHAVVRVSQDARVNVVATHLNAGDRSAARSARTSQLEQLRAFIDEIDPATGPTVVLGDFNVDALDGSGEYEELIDQIDVRAHAVRHPSTLNCDTTIQCEEPEPPRRLDYVFARGIDDRIVRRDAEHLPMEDRACGSRYLSDHRAVRATFGLDL